MFHKYNLALRGTVLGGKAGPAFVDNLAFDFTHPLNFNLEHNRGAPTPSQRGAGSSSPPVP